MESLPPPLVNRKWLLCTLGCFLGYLLISYSLQKVYRPSTTFASFPDLDGTAHLSKKPSTVPSLAETSAETYVEVPPVSTAPVPCEAFVQELEPTPTPPSVIAAMSPRATTEADASPQPSAVAGMAFSPSDKAELLSPDSSLVHVTNFSGSPIRALPPKQSNDVDANTSSYSSQIITTKEILTAEVTTPAARASEEGNVVKEKKKCDVFDGRWVYDRKRYPLYRSRWCPFLTDQVSCQRNGRPDSDYEHWRWQPNGCDLPRFNGSEMLERWRGKRVVIVGDSLNRNMWESLACMLYSSVRRKRADVKLHGSDYKVFRALDYDCSVEFFWSPFLVELKEREDHAKILRLDKLPAEERRWLGADVMVFNTGHWWTHRGKMRAWNYLERSEELMEDMEAEEAFQRALRTWAQWVDRNVDPGRTAVFFRSISPEHKRENLHWCYNQTHPITNDTYLQQFPRSMVSLVETTIRKMRTPVTYLNITRLSEYRRDAHTSIYTSRQGKLLTVEQRKEPARYADCSHWCLPGLPDTWNVLLFASLIMGTTPSIIS
ncbi:hypothetical protein C4D60_Mb04t15400 [Musa balbisiana]|uniref:Uncharacterized protein n=1 Tax=Musa balbisiana TaxID=52838 RepID=A0A4S8KC71_MUSBA|nr:hypothetical protein C4D60_Mb04t15400 [Musa balbisiana]